MKHAPRQPGLLMRLPLILIIWAVMSVAMWVPASYALSQDNHSESQAFFFSGLIGLVLVTMIALARTGRAIKHGHLGQLATLFVAFTILPAFLAVPFHDAARNTSFLNAYFEMVSAFTTTGATLFDDPTRLEGSLHLWRALVAWLGGLMMWIAASAILAPLSLGGFEVTARGEPGRMTRAPVQADLADPRQRLLLVSGGLIPVYVGLTAILWLLQLIGGEETLTAICHAMSVMATSGISPVGGLEHDQTGIGVEAVLFLFMFFALSRLTFSSDTAQGGYARLDTDPEFRTGLLLIVLATLVIFGRHWLAALDVSALEQPEETARALWGTLFTVVSFLTTTGFESAEWDVARAWSGLGTPGFVLMGLALVGGGVATTAGGVKLLRVYALYLNGLREMERLVHPSSVSSRTGRSRRIQRNGAFIAWVFFMLFAMSLALITVILAALGVAFDNAIVLAIASLSTTGPLVDFALEDPIRLADLGGAAKGVLCAAMVLGRLETLAIIALFTPNLWRN